MFSEKLAFKTKIINIMCRQDSDRCVRLVLSAMLVDVSSLSKNRQKTLWRSFRWTSWPFYCTRQKFTPTSKNNNGG